MMPLFFAAAEAAFDIAHEIKSGHSAKMKALLDIPMEKVEYENQGKYGKCAVLILALRFFLLKESSTSRMSLMTPSSQDWSLKISDRLNVTNSGFINYILLKKRFCLFAHTLLTYLVL